MEDDYNELTSEERNQRQYSGIIRGIGKDSGRSLEEPDTRAGRKYHNKILARRGRDDRPKNEESINKVRKLYDRRGIKRSKYNFK